MIFKKYVLQRQMMINRLMLLRIMLFCLISLGRWEMRGVPALPFCQKIRSEADLAGFPISPWGMGQVNPMMCGFPWR